MFVSTGAANEIVVDVRSAVRNNNIAARVSVPVRNIRRNVVCLVDRA